MATFEREELIATLTDVKPALSAGGLIAEFSYLWFQGKHVCAFDGGLGVRLPLVTEFECGVPGRPLMDLLKTSTLKQVFLDVVKENLVIQMGKAKVNLATLDLERCPWKYPTTLPKKGSTSIVLTERVFEALSQVLFVKTSTPVQSYHFGVTFSPLKSGLELYTTDSKSIAQVAVEERPAVGVPKFVAPWGFLDRVTELIEPGAELHILDDCLMVGAKGILICTNRLELPPDWDVGKTISTHLNAMKNPVALPDRFQQVLDRAVIISGKEEALINLLVKGDTLKVEGEYALGSVNETFQLKGKMGDMKGRFPADLIVRGLKNADSFALTAKALVLCGGDDFNYVLAGKGST